MLKSLDSDPYLASSSVFSLPKLMRIIETQHSLMKDLKNCKALLHPKPPYILVISEPHDYRQGHFN